jgi:phosphoglycerol transferase MdoB-like AlkP superfamily enzyme
VFQVAAVAALPESVDSVAVARARGVGAYQVASIARAAARTVAGDDAAYAGGGSSSAGAVMQKRIDELRQGSSGARVAGVQAAAYPNANVILIQVEAYQALAYNAKIAEQEVTPNMNRLAEDCWVFTNAFSQTGAGNTADAEFIVQSGLLPPVNRAASVAYADKRIPGLPRLLSKAGYRSVTMHANEATFWNRKELYPALGFDDYYDAEQYGSYDKMYRGASDEVFVSRSMDFIADELQWGKPLYATLVTMSSHAPYRGVPEDRRPLYLPEELKGSRAGDWLGALSYTDLAVGELIAWMKESGLWDDSIVILYGDHVALKDLELKGKDKTLVEGILGRPYSEVDRQRVPLMIHLPGQTEGGTIDTTVGQVDIMPTVADLVGVSLDDVPHLGRSVFIDADPLVMTRSYFPAGSFINGNVAFMPQLSFEDGVALDIHDGQYMAASAVERADYKRTRELSELSEKWVRSLPVRPDAGDIRDAYIPVASQRSEE